MEVQQFAVSDAEMKQEPIQSLPTMMPQQTSSNSNDPWETAPLPHGWEKAYDENGNRYFVDHTSGKTSWDHPDKPSAPSSN